MSLGSQRKITGPCPRSCHTSKWCSLFEDSGTGAASPPRLGVQTCWYMGLQCCLSTARYFPQSRLRHHGVPAGSQYSLLKETIHEGGCVSEPCKHWWNPDFSPMLADGRMSLCRRWPNSSQYVLVCSEKFWNVSEKKKRRAAMKRSGRWQKSRRCLCWSWQGGSSWLTHFQKSTACSFCTSAARQISMETTGVVGSLPTARLHSILWTRSLTCPLCATTGAGLSMTL